MQRRKFDVLSAKVKGENLYWTVLGKAWENEHNIKIELNALPVSNPNGDIFVYLKEQSNVSKSDESKKVG